MFLSPLILSPTATTNDDHASCRAEVTTEIGDGATDIHIDSGSQLRLECKLRYVTEVPTFVFW